MAVGITMFPKNIVPGGKAVVVLFGWAPDQPIGLYISNALTLPSVQVNGSGNKTFVIQVPTGTIPGTYTLQAVNSSDNTNATVGFSVSNTGPTTFGLCVFNTYTVPLYGRDSSNIRTQVILQIINIGNENCTYSLASTLGSQSGNLSPSEQANIAVQVPSFLQPVELMQFALHTISTIQGNAKNIVTDELQWFITAGQAPPGVSTYVNGEGPQGSSLDLIAPINQGGGTRTDLSILVSDKATSQPIANASVTLTGGGNITGTTGTGGIFESVIPQGSYTLSVNAANYGQFVGTVNVTGSTMNYGVQLVANTSGGGGTGGGISSEFSAFIAWLEKNPIASAVAAGLILIAVTHKKEKRQSVRVIRS